MDTIVRMEVTEFIKSRATLHREIWMIPLLDELSDVVRAGTPTRPE